jgi:hypothetical protein
VGGIGIGRGPFDKEVKGRGFGASTAGGVGGNFAVQKLVNFVGIPVNKVTGITEGLVREGAIREVIGVVVRPGQKARDMKHRVDTGHGWREVKAVGDRGDDGGDGEGTKVSGFYFGTGVFREGDVVGREADTVPDGEREGTAVTVGLFSLLGFGEFEGGGDGGLDFTEVGEVVGSIRVTTGVNKEWWGCRVETIVGKEGGLLGGGVDRVVVGKLGDGEPWGPVGVLGGDIGTEDLFDGAVGNLRLAVSLGVMRGGEVEFGAKGREDGLPEIRGDAGVTVRDNDSRDTLFGKDVIKEEVGQTGGWHSLVSADEVSLFGEHVNKGGDGVIGQSIMAEGGRKVGDEVHGDVSPRANGDRVGLEKTGECLGWGFDALADGTWGDIGADGASHARPPEAGRDGIEGFTKAGVTSNCSIMVFKQKALTEGRIIGYANAVIEVPYLVMALKVAGAFGVVGSVKGIGGVGGFDVIQEGVSEEDMGRV